MTTLGLRDLGFLAAATANGADALRVNRLLILHANGSNGSTSFADSSPSNNTITPNGNAQISTTQSRFAGASAYFDGAGDWLNATSSASPQSGDFTVELFLYPTLVTGTDRVIYDCRGTAGGAASENGPNGTGVVLFINANARLQVFGNGSGSTAGTLYSQSSASVTANTWQHIALVSQSNTVTYYINKVSAGSFTAATTQSKNTRIGARQDGAAAFTGYIDEFIVTSTALTASQFTYDAQVPDF